jgi:hypothetical protein
VLHEQLRNAWHVRKRAVPISPVLNLTPEGLVLGAATVLVPADGPRRLQSLRGRETRVLALLSAAYGKAIAASVLGNIERAAKAWREGDDCLAYIHLAHAGLRDLQDPYESARRLFIVDGFMKAGTSPRAVFDALGLGAAYADTIEKLYNPDEPRVPAGSGRISGQWTRLLSWIGELDATQIVELGAYASRVLGLSGAAAAAFGLLFIPSPNNIRVDGEVTGIPGLRYSWNRDETVLHLTYDGAGGAQRTFALNVDGDLIRDDDGQTVGHVIGGNRIAIDTIAVLPDLVKQDQPRLCPAPALDVAGSDQGKQYEENKSRQYEDFVKLLINPPPEGPTPSGFVYYLPLPEGGEQSYDDCKKLNGFLFEIKGEGLAKLTNDLPGAIGDKFVDQASRQLAASGGRPVIWIFAERDAALFTRTLFDLTPGLGRITVGYVPWTRSNR